jgi:hypothetical protein
VEESVNTNDAKFNAVTPDERAFAEKPRPRRAARAIPKRPIAQSVRRRASPLKRAIQVGVAVYLVFAIYIASKGNVTGAIAGSMVNAFAILPAALWVSRVAKGFPIFPLYAFTFTYTFGFQMMEDRADVMNMPPELLWRSCIAIGGFLIIATAVWLPRVRTPRRPPEVVMIAGGRREVPVLYWGMALSTLYYMAASSGWLGMLGVWGTIVRALMYCIGALSVFILFYEMGHGRIGRVGRIWMLFLLILSMLALGAGLLLVQAMGLGLLALAGYVIASHRIPWKTLAFSLLLATVLQFGKYTMRQKYWHEAEEAMSNVARFTPGDYPELYKEWMTAGVDYLAHKEKYTEMAEDRADLLERSGLMHVFLFAQEESEHRPLLMGKTYSLLPQMLMPRALSGGKVASHETTHLLNIHFGLQTRDDTATTTIGWGLFNEAYANFGYLGLAGLAVVLALFFSAVTRYSMGCPVTSFQGLVAIAVVNTAYQTEFTSGVFVTVLFQSFIVLLALRYAIMQPVRIDPTKRATLGVGM